MLRTKAIAFAVCVSAATCLAAAQAPPAPPEKQPVAAPLPPDHAVYWKVAPGQAVAGSNAGRGGRWNYGVQLAGGVGLQDRSNFGFLMAGGHAGRQVTPQLGSGILQGALEYGVEVIPFWQSYTPKFQRILCPAGATTASQCSAPYTVGGTYTGVSVTPILLRWNFTDGERVMPYVQGGGGVVYTTRKYPAVGSLNAGDATETGAQANTSVWNFTPQFGIGMHYFTRPQRSVDVSASAVHLSSASLGDKNPGVNASVIFSVGYSWWK